MSESKYCLALDGAGVGTLYENTCPPVQPGNPVPFRYILGPAATDNSALAMCAQTDPITSVQSFITGACAAGVKGFTFYTYNQNVSGQVSLCLMPPNVAGVNGTVITTQPTESGKCEKTLYVKYQNVTCNELGCGDHGKCVNGVCNCQDNWVGSQCEVPPSSNNGCTPDTSTKKSCGNLGSYGTCQASTSSTTGITGSGQCTCNFLTSQQGNYCEKACSAGDNTSCGGPLRGYCVDGDYNYYTNSNAIKNRCICVNGWSGAECTVPPSGWQCDDSTNLCTNITTEKPEDTIPTGVCTDKKCVCNNNLDCNAQNSFGQAFTGIACQNPLSVVGDACKVDGDCIGQGQTCVNNVCSCNSTPEPSDSRIDAILQGLAAMLLTPEGLAKFASYILIQSKLPMLLKWMTTKVLEKQFLKQITSRLAEGAAGKALGAGALKTLEDSVGKSLAAKVLAKMTAKELLEATGTSVASKVAETAFKEVFGVLGKIDTVVTWLGIVGMVLDATDVMGLQEESKQAQIDATLLKINGAVNNNKTVLQNGLYFPIRQYADETFPFMLQTVGTPSRNQFAIDTGNYISHLTVNSNGSAIIPLFTTPVQKQQNQLLKDAKGSLLYTLAGQNLDVYQRLKQDWPIIVAGILVAIGALIGSAYGIKALVNKKKIAKQ